MHRGEGVFGGKKVWVTGRRFTIVNGKEGEEGRAGQSQPLGIGVQLEWPTPRIR